MKTMILVDSCCDLPKDYILENKGHIDVIGMPVIIGDKEYFDDLGQTFNHDNLYDNLRSGVKPSTSRISSFRFVEKYKRHLEKGYDIIYIGLSKNMSRTNQNANKAISLALELFPEGRIKVLQSTSASLGQGLLALKAVEMVKDALDFDTIFDWLDKHQENVQHWFAVNNLHHLKKGGRITASQAVIGKLLNVKPIFIVDAEGSLKPFVNVKGKNKSLKYLIEKIKALYDPMLFDQILLGHGDALEDVLLLKKKIEIELPNIRIMITEFSATIATHVGPDMLAIGFMGNSRKDIE